MKIYMTLLLVFFSPLSFSSTNLCSNPFEFQINSNVSIKLCEVAAGKAVEIGSNIADNEKPIIKRHFKHDYQIGQYEVTQAQFVAVMGDDFPRPWLLKNGNPRGYVIEGGDYPVSYITYPEAIAFARALSLMDPDGTYRLPTEAEWENAAKANSKTKYYWGDKFDGYYTYSKLDYSETGNHPKDVTTCPNERFDTKYPGYCANDFGLMHMSGNVEEIVRDEYASDHSKASADGHVPRLGHNETNYVLKGGHYLSDPFNQRSSSRASTAFLKRTYNIGFRVVRIPN